jgi:threonine aldolase
MLLGKLKFIEESRIWLRRFGGNLFQMHPFVASAAMRFDRALGKMSGYTERTKKVYEVLKEIPNISFCPSSPQINMFHLYFNASVEKLTEARNTIARKEKIWMANSFNQTTLKNLSYTEIYVGDGLLEIEDKNYLMRFQVSSKYQYKVIIKTEDCLIINYPKNANRHMTFVMVLLGG